MTQLIRTTISEPITNLTSEELATRLRKSPGTLANWRVVGKGPRFLPGRPVTYPIQEVEKYEQEEAKKSTADIKRKRK